MENIKLTNEQKKLINKYRLYLQAVIGDEQIYWDGYLSEDEGLYDFSGPYSRGYNQSDDIDPNGDAARLINNIVDEIYEGNSNELVGYLYCDDCTGYGSLNVRFSPKDNVIYSSLSITTRETQENENFMAFDDLKNQTQNQWGTTYSYLKKIGDDEFIEKMKKDYGDILTITYDGGGDSGQINDYGETDHGSVRINQDIEYTGYEIIDLYHSGWENNEGGDGTIIFNFEERTVRLFHNMNYEDEFVQELNSIKLF
jgi:hypothetical protein